MKIDKNIPIPKMRRNIGKWSEVFYKMKILDSIVVETAKDRMSLMHFMRRRGFKATSRRVDGGYRVWKTKNDS